MTDFLDCNVAMPSLVETGLRRRIARAKAKNTCLHTRGCIFGLVKRGLCPLDCTIDEEPRAVRATSQLYLKYGQEHQHQQCVLTFRGP